MKKSDEIRNAIKVAEIRANVVEMLERNMESELYVFDDTTGEYVIVEPSDKRLDDDAKLKVGVYIDIIDAIMKMK